VSPGLLWALHQVRKERATGVLDIEWEKFKKQIFFKKGDPQGIRSNWNAEAFGKFLILHKKIEKADLKLELQKKRLEKDNQFLGEWLIKKGAVEASEIVELLEEHFKERIFNLLPLVHGKILFHSLESVDDIDLEIARLSEDFDKLLTDASRKYLTSQVCRSKLGPFISRKGKISQPCPLTLNSKELRIWNQLSSATQLVSKLDNESIWSMAIAAEFQLIDWAESQAVELSKELNKMAEKFKAASPYEILGVSLEASALELKKAYMVFVKKYHPDRMPSDSSPELRLIGQNVFAKINEAHAIMSDPERLSDLKAELELEKAGGRKYVEKRLQAESILPQAKAALRRRHFKGAFKAFKEIETILDDDGEVKADRIYSEMMLMVEEKADYKPQLNRFKQELESAIQLNSKYAPAFYYRGMIYNLEGNVQAAIRDFEQATKMDRNFKEAGSQLRLLKKRHDKKKSGFFGK